MAERFFTVEEPANLDNNDSSPYTLGLRFTCLAPGQVTHIRYWRPNTSPTNLVGFILWRNINQAQLSYVEVPGASLVAGWNEVALPAPVTLTVGESYTSSYYTADRYVSSGGVPYWPKPSTGGSLVTLSPAGFYSGEFSLQYPNNEFNQANYFADVVFVADDEEPSGPTVSVWNGSAELPATVGRWNGSSEAPATIEIA